MGELVARLLEGVCELASAFGGYIYPHKSRYLDVIFLFCTFLLTVLQNVQGCVPSLLIRTENMHFHYLTNVSANKTAGTHCYTLI